MTEWRVAYWPRQDYDPANPSLGYERPCFRVVPEGNLEGWIAETNPDLPREVQEEAAVFLADALSKAFG
jgi:hypothetical protein